MIGKIKIMTPGAPPLSGALNGANDACNGASNDALRRHLHRHSWDCCLHLDPPPRLHDERYNRCPPSPGKYHTFPSSYSHLPSRYVTVFYNFLKRLLKLQKAVSLLSTFSQSIDVEVQEHYSTVWKVASGPVIYSVDIALSQESNTIMTVNMSTYQRIAASVISRYCTVSANRFNLQILREPGRTHRPYVKYCTYSTTCFVVVNCQNWLRSRVVLIMIQCGTRRGTVSTLYRNQIFAFSWTWIKKLRKSSLYHSQSSEGWATASAHCLN